MRRFCRVHRTWQYEILRGISQNNNTWKGKQYKKEFQKEQEKTKVLEVKNEILEITIKNCIADDNKKKNKIDELKGELYKKHVQEEEHTITIASEEALTKMLLKDEKKKEKEWREHQGILRNLTINNNPLLIEMKKQKQEVSILKNRWDKTKKHKQQQICRKEWVQKNIRKLRRKAWSKKERMLTKKERIKEWIF